MRPLFRLLNEDLVQKLRQLAPKKDSSNPPLSARITRRYKYSKVLNAAFRGFRRSSKKALWNLDHGSEVWHLVIYCSVLPLTPFQERGLWFWFFPREASFQEREHGSDSSGRMMGLFFTHKGFYGSHVKVDINLLLIEAFGWWCDYTMVRRQAHWKARTHYVLLYVACIPLLSSVGDALVEKHVRKDGSVLKKLPQTYHVAFAGIARRRWLHAVVRAL
jgi:hypothetical protein